VRRKLLRKCFLPFIGDRAVADEQRQKRLAKSYDSDVFFVVLARDKQKVLRKIAELDEMKLRYIVLCREKMDHRMGIYRRARGKWDAINYARRFIPADTSIVARNDTSICNLERKDGRAWANGIETAVRARAAQRFSTEF
jgi:hypothetical protein